MLYLPRLYFLQVTCTKLTKGVKLDWGKFDILASDLSKKFQAYTNSSHRFAERFLKIQIEKDKEKRMDDSDSPGEA